MKKTSNKKRQPSSKAKRKAESTSNDATPVEMSPDVTRRNVLAKARNIALGVAAVGGVGAFVGHSVTSAIAEHDLTRVTNGTPTVVQVHDPNCPLCRSLQRATKKALKTFDRGQIDYVIANIKGEEGQAFAARYRVPHVTLLLFDGSGELVEILQGQRTAEELQFVFQDLLVDASTG